MAVANSMHFIGKMESINISSNQVAANVTQPLVTDNMLIPTGGVIVLENLVAFFILYRCRRLNFQIKILSMNLVLSDLSTGVVLCFPLSFFNYGDNCEFKKYLLFCCLNVSLFTVTMYNLDRCLIFALAMQYYKYVTKLRLMCLCSLFWVTGVITSYLMFYNEDLPFKISCKFPYESQRNTVSQSTRYLILSTIVSNLCMYIYLLHYIRKRKHEIGVAHVDSSSVITDPHINIVKKISVISGTFLILATPFYVTFIFPILDYSTPAGKTIHNVCGISLVLNSAMNPVLYIWRMYEPRYHLKMLIMRWNTTYCEKLEQEYKQRFATFNMDATRDTTPRANTSEL